VRHVGAAVAEVHDRRRRALDAAHVGAERGVDRAQERPRVRCRQGDHYRVGRDRLTRRRRDAPPGRAGLPVDPGHPRPRAQRPRRQGRQQRLDQRPDAAAQAREEAEARAARAGRGARLAHEAEDQAAVPALQLEEARHRRGERERLGVGRVDTADHRLRDAIEHLGAETSAHERSQALVAAGRRSAARQDDVGEGAQLAAWGQDRRAHERQQARRREELERIGQREERAVAHDQGTAEALVRRHEVVAEAEPSHQGSRFGLVGDEGVRAALEQEALAALGRDHPACALRRFEHEQLDAVAAALDRAVRGREAADAAADHDQARPSRAAFRRRLARRRRRPWGGVAVPGVDAHRALSSCTASTSART
jgi:hypothetical protein